MKVRHSYSKKKDQTSRKGKPICWSMGSLFTTSITLPNKENIPIELNVSLKGAKMTMQLGTGASYPIFCESTYRKLGKANPPVINILPFISRYILEKSWKFLEKPSTLCAQGVNTVYLTGMDWNEIHHQQTKSGVDEILQKRAVVVQDKLGTLKGMKILLHVDQNARPHFFKPRPVQFCTKR